MLTKGQLPIEESSHDDTRNLLSNAKALGNRLIKKAQPPYRWLSYSLLDFLSSRLATNKAAGTVITVKATIPQNR